MKLIKVAAVSMNQTPFDWEGNYARIRSSILQAKSEGVSILCLPELVISGYGCEDAFHMPYLQEESWWMLVKLLPDTKGMVVALGLPVTHRGAIFNVVAMIVDGKIQAVVPKKLLAGDGVHYEPRWFKPWPAGVIESLESDGQIIPIGDLYVDVGGVRIGFEICEEAWVANRPGANLARKGIDIILNPSASHFAFGKREVRERFVVEGSRAFNVAYLYSNLLGNESGRIVFDGQAMVASEGQLKALGPRFSWRDFVVTSAVIDVAMNRMNKTRSGSFQPLLGEPDTGCVECAFDWPDIAASKSVPVTLPAWEKSDDLKAEELTRAVALGLFDFLRKSRLHGFTVSLSGGVDSSAVAILATMSMRMALKDIGLTGLREKLGYINALHTCHDEASIIKALIQTLYQGTKNSSDETARAARSLATALGVTHLEWSVDKVVANYESLVAEAFGTKLNWKDHDGALQNIQARARAPGVWMLANIKNHLLLATSNRSEVAVGYATMDGDTAGGLAPISGVDKAYLRQWVRWYETKGPEGFGPIPSLNLVTSVPPTAELRPKEAHQTDEKDLMPYDVLDVIERLAIKDKKSPKETLQSLVVYFPDHQPQHLKDWVKKFFRLWCQSQWKRERYAPGFHLDELNLDPKSWCRFPILSGAFHRELHELESIKP
jgi:NAD+ synthase (glutamine-hydrolysing)